MSETNQAAVDYVAIKVPLGYTVQLLHAESSIRVVGKSNQTIYDLKIAVTGSGQHSITLPKGAKPLFNKLAQGILAPDQYAVGLPNGIVIDIDWLPEDDQTGIYHIVARNGITELERRTAADVPAAMRWVERLAAKYL